MPWNCLDRLRIGLNRLESILTIDYWSSRARWPLPCSFWLISRRPETRSSATTPLLSVSHFIKFSPRGVCLVRFDERLSALYGPRPFFYLYPDFISCSIKICFQPRYRRIDNIATNGTTPIIRIAVTLLKLLRKNCSAIPTRSATEPVTNI